MMRFEELRLLVAIHSLQPKGDPVSDHSRMKRARHVRDEYTRLFGDVFFPWTVSEVIEMCVAWRKQTSCRMKAAIAAAHGYECFWKDRDKGPCSEEAEAGHIVPRCSGAELTVANGMIECRAHNNQRRARTIEEYVKSEDTTYRPRTERQSGAAEAMTVTVAQSPQGGRKDAGTFKEEESGDLDR